VSIGNHPHLYWQMLMLFFSGALLLAGAWYLVITRSKNSKHWNVLVPLLAGTFSYSWLALCLAAPSPLGHSYSNTRYIIIDANFVVALLAALVAFTRFKMDGILIGV
jgi:hypothetical protein